MRLCRPARMGGGGKAESLPWRGPAGEARHTGVTIQLWEREGKALGVPGSPKTEPSGFPNREAEQHRHPCTSRSQPDGVRAQLCASAHPAMSEARVPAGQDRNADPSGARSAGQSASARTPAQPPTLLIVTRMGRDTRPGSRQRIEQVARRAAPHQAASNRAARDTSCE